MERTTTSEMGNNEVSYSIVAETHDHGDMVARAEYGESSMTFIVDSENHRINVWHVNSAEKGDMKTMLDHLMSHVPTDEVMFIDPLTEEDKQVANLVYRRMGMEEASFDAQENNRDIREALHGFTEETIETARGEIEVLTGTWDSERN